MYEDLALALLPLIWVIVSVGAARTLHNSSSAWFQGKRHGASEASDQQSGKLLLGGSIVIAALIYGALYMGTKRFLPSSGDKPTGRVQRVLLEIHGKQVEVEDARAELESCIARPDVNCEAEMAILKVRTDDVATAIMELRGRR